MFHFGLVSALVPQNKNQYILIITFNTESREKRFNLELRMDAMLFAATKQSQTITNNIKGPETIFNS